MDTVYHSVDGLGTESYGYVLAASQALAIRDEVAAVRNRR
jgi:hypothetical protein